ncbi:MAG: TIGR03905 family TSCPD domain-containing protein [Acutalibacteraceae bacterium]|nr:TIGR03905 family TSCPD domain-containing protein [Bacillota bacterium]
MQYRYKPSGVCSREIIIDVEDGIVSNVKFIGGCAGNTQGIGALVKGMKVDDVIRRLDGINCGFRGTSCPDQLAKALTEISK